MTDGTMATIAVLVVGVLATSVAAVVVSRERRRQRRGTAEHQALALRDDRLRVEQRVLDVQIRELRTQIADLQRRRADLVAEVQVAAAGRDPAPAVAAGALRLAHGLEQRELARRLERAGDGRVIPFPFLPDRHAEASD